MPSLANISSAEFTNALTPERLRTGMLIQAVLGLGPLSFLAAVMLVAFTHPLNEAETESLSFLTTLTIANFVMLIALAGAGQVIFRTRFTPARLESAFIDDLRDQQGHPIAATAVEKAIAFIRTAMLIRTALFEASAFFGLTVLIIAATNGVLLTVPWLWVNGIPLAILLVMIAFTFPTNDRMQSIFETNILHNV